jgi:hypothetical protein
VSSGLVHACGPNQRDLFVEEKGRKDEQKGRDGYENCCVKNLSGLSKCDY